MKIQKKKKILRYGVVALVVLALMALAALYLYQPKQISKKTHNQERTGNTTQVNGFDKTKYSIDTPGSPWWIVSKKRPLPSGFVAPDLVTPAVSLNPTKSDSENTLRKDTAAALEKLFAGAKSAGIDYMLASGYRSEALQSSYYNNYVAKSGQAEADRYSARPGTSEHQTGMALDVATTDRKNYLDQAFGKDPGGAWLADHAHEYGFVIRYPEGKESVTGYMYEPWHIRFVGVELANELYKKHQTMEEFFGL